MARRKLKVGMVVWSVIGDYESGIELDKWVISIIRKRYGTLRIYFIRKDSLTWVKKSSKHYDYGWADNIPYYSRQWITIDDYEKRGLPYGLSFSKSGAYKLAIAYSKKNIKRIEEDVEDFFDQEDLEVENKTLKTLKRMHTKYKNKGE